MSHPKRLPGWQVVFIHVSALVLLSCLIVYFNWSDSLLLVFVVPCVVLAFFYGRWVYLSMAISVVVAAVWVTSLVSISFFTSLTTIAVATLSVLAMAEMVRAVALARARAQEILNRQSEESRYLAEMGMALLNCDRADLVFEQLGVFLRQVTSDVIIIINQATPDQQSLITRQVIGLEGPLWAQAEKLVGFEIIGKVSPIVPKLRDYSLQARLQKIPGGFSELSASEIPKAVGQAAEKLFGFQDVFTIGIADQDTIWGDVHIITLRPVDPESTGKLPVHLIEAVVYQCFSVLSRIHYQDHLEDLIQTRTAELQAQYAQLDAILRSVGDAIFMTDPDLHIRYVNPTFTTLTGYAAEEVLGQEVSTLDVLVRWVSRLPSIMPTLRQDKIWRGDVDIRRQDGRHYDAALTIAPVHDESGQITGYVFTHRDISQAKDLERARAQFITNVSHQFRTPLTLLKTNIYLLLHDPTEKQRRQLQAMQASVNWLIQLVQDTLEILALDSGQGVEVWKPVALPDIVGDVLERYQSQAQAAGLTLVAAPVLPDVPPVMGDANRLAQALSELVENAVVFTPAGGQVTVALHTSVVGGENWVTVAVQDTGPGIAPAEQSRLFERFFRGRLAESGHTAGIGLGLSIAQKIAQAHGGRITVESAVGRGSTFTLWVRSVFLEGGTP